MGSFGTASNRNLEGVHPLLVAVAQAAVKVIDHSVFDGVRTPEEQAENIVKGVSWTKDSKHLIQSDGYSHAIDVGPFIPGKGTDWKDVEMFCFLAGVYFTCAHALGVKLRWGGDWNQNMETDDERKRDYGHFEIVV